MMRITPILFLMCCVLAGCADQSAVTTEILEPASEPQSSDSMAQVATKSDPTFVRGTGMEAPPDDAVADGWNSEQVAKDVHENLNNLIQRLTDSTVPNASLRTESPVEFTVPSMSANAIEKDKFTIYQAVDSTKSQQGTIDELLVTARGMLDFAGTPNKVHSKLKVTRVESSGDVVDSETLVQIWGISDKGRFQLSANWKASWSIGGEGAKQLHLTRLEIQDLKQVSFDGVASPFVDITSSTFANEPVFERQLRRGVDYWMQYIPLEMGIDVGGWQGMAIGDINNDGLDDLYVSQPGGLPNRLFVQQPDGSCRDISQSAGVGWLDTAHASLLVDLDNDGDQDLVVGVNEGVIIMSNDGTGKFTSRAGLICPAAIPYSLAAADYDQDADLDIYVCCYDRRAGVNSHRLFAKAIPYHDANNGGRNVLLRNETTPATGDWQFRYVTVEAGLDSNNRRFSYAAAWEDFDNDGDLDLYVANDFGRNNLYRNDNTKFVDIAADAGVEDISAGMSVAWGDYDRDGWMDVYVSNMFSSAGNRITFQRKFQDSADGETKQQFQRHARGNTLFKNTGDGSFRDVSVEADVTMGRWAWGSLFADLDNDGWQDLVVGNGFITQSNSGDL